MKELFLDFETYNDRPIKDGTYVYTSTCEPLILTYALDDGPIYDIDFTIDDHDVTPFHIAIDEADVLIAHGTMFDRNVLRYGLGTDVPVERWYDTMVQAFSHSLPGGMEILGEIFRLGESDAKIKDGKKLIQLFGKPRPKNAKIRRATRHTHPHEWARFIEYARGDIHTMRLLHRKMPSWNYRFGSQDHKQWCLDQKINDRGMYIDLSFAENAVAADAREKARLKTAVREQTNGEVQSATKVNQLLEYILAEAGIALPDMQKATLERRLNDPDVPDFVKELLRIRLAAASTSATKYKALMKATMPDGRIRGTKQYRGAGRTGRWGGRTFQPDNLARPDVGQIALTLGISPKDVGGEEIGRYVDTLVHAVAAECEDLVFPSVQKALNTAIRSAIIAPPGCKLVISDYSNIEGRLLAWLAGEEWKLRAFEDFDAGVGPDLYKLAFARAFGIAPDDVDKWGRSVGKVFELMLGYEGGVGAFVTGAATYGLDLEELAVRARPSIPGDVWNEAKRFYAFCLKKRMSTYGLSEEVFCVCDSLKRMWRRSNSNIAAWWGELKGTAMLAIANPGEEFICRKVTMRMDGAWLRIILPSGRSLCYPGAKIENDGITFMGVSPYTKKWCRQKTHGGKLAENITQAAAADVLADRQLPVDDEGYAIVLHVHDENVTEVPDTPDYNAHELSMLMSELPAWAQGLPLAAEGYETYRYRKDG